jgi:internalin A
MCLKVIAYTQISQDYQDAWDELSIDWKRILKEKAQEKSRNGFAFSLDHVSQIRELTIDSTKIEEVDNLKVLLLTPNLRSLTIHSVKLESLDGAEFLPRDCSLNIYDVDCTFDASAFFKVKEVIRPSKTEIFLGKIRIGEEALSTSSVDRIEKAYVPDRVWFWWESLSSLDQKLICNILELPAHQRITRYSIGGFDILQSFFYAKKVTIDFADIDIPVIPEDGLKFLQILTNLRVLEIVNSFSLKSLDFLSRLSSLDILICENNSFSSLDGIEHLEDLTGIELINNNISNIGAISGLPNLQTFISKGNYIREIKNIFPLNKLRVLCISSNKVPIDVTGIENLLNLRSLYLNNNSELLSIDDVFFPNKLQEIAINYSNINNIDFIDRCQQLRKLSLRFNNIDDVCVLRRCTNLEYIDIRGNNLTNLYCLTELRNIKFIDIGENNIDNLNFIIPMTALAVLRADDNDISVFPSNNSKDLHEIRLNRNRLTDLLGLESNASTLKTVSIAKQNTGEFISTFPDLVKFVRLNELHIFDINLTPRQKYSIMKGIVELMEKGVLKDVPCIWF